MRKILSQHLTFLQNYLLPARCILCGGASQRNENLCLPCIDDLPWIKNACVSCGQALPLSVAKNNLCGSCLLEVPPYDHAIILWQYQPPIKRLITKLKFQEKLIHAKLLGELLAQHITEKYMNHELPDCIIPMPLHPRRLRARGFNQALELARPISKKLQIVIDYSSCQRIRNTLAQSVLHAKERHANVKKAFHVVKPLAKHVAVLDDVITTGNTMNELCKTLRQAGAEKIDVWCCARTKIPHAVA